jgi:hypothetical protein
MPSYIISRPPNDSFTLRLFYNLSKDRNLNADWFYIWSASMFPSNSFNFNVVEYWDKNDELLYRTGIMENLKEDLVIVGIKDHLSYSDFNYWADQKPSTVCYLEDMLTYYSDKKFIIFTSLENLDAYLKTDNLIKIIPWGGDITNQMPYYKKLNPVLDKNFDSEYNYLSLNRHFRSNRAYQLALLFGLNLEKHGLISCMFQDSILDVHGRFNWRFTEGQQGIKNMIKSGNKKLIDYNFPINDHYDIYESSDNNNNVGNFEKNLVNYYKNTFVELICETTYTEKSFLITEKTQHSVFGCNFPIWISSPGTVDFLRKMGLDVFDDVVDHSYDSIENPIDRLYAAISNNKDILSNPNIKDIWKKNRSRFEKNVDFIKKEMYEFYAVRAREQIDQLYEHFK